MREGDSALDVGCGPGPVTEKLAGRLGADNVAAVDPSKSFVAACRARVPGADVRVASAESLPFADDSFDVVLSQLVVNFMSDAERGLQEMARVARRTVAACVWDYAGEMWMVRHFWDGALDVDPDAPAEGRTMRYCAPGELAELWRGAGLRNVETDALVVEASYEGFDDYWYPFPFGLGPTGAYAASLPPERRDALRAAIFRRLGEPQGPFALTARAWSVRGEV